MKTLKTIKQECIEFYSQNAVNHFSKSFSKKMGGTQTITFENDFLPCIEIDKKEYYKGRGARYNNCSMHEHISVFVTKKEFNERVNYRSALLFNWQKEQQEDAKRLNAFCKKHGLKKTNYNGINAYTLFFSFSKKNAIEKELNIDLTDFFNASGKTYFFVNSKIGLLCFYHNHRQSYSFSFATEDYRAEFYSERDNWINAPYAHLLGQTENKNLFVC